MLSVVQSTQEFKTLRVHSLESFGTVDGPGVRFVVFVQGCPLRCAYCHNPDTWAVNEGKVYDIDELVFEIEKYKSFLSGGVTVSGGEPLLQAKALIYMFDALKKLGIHTCIDTSGYVIVNETIEALLKVTDLVLLDIKHIDDIKHTDLTQVSNKKTLAFAKYLDSIGKPTWIRYVLVPSKNDSKEDILKLKSFIDTLSNVEKVEVLPYHEFGVFKWKEMGLDYPLTGIEPPTEASLAYAKSILES